MRQPVLHGRFSLMFQILLYAFASLGAVWLVCCVVFLVAMVTYNPERWLD